MFSRLAVRDLAFLAAVFGLWWLAARATAGSGPGADFLGVVVGLGLGASAYLIHEWGHLTGALLSGSHVEAPRSLGSISLFSFDSKQNSRGQFLAMSFAGFAMTGVALLVAYGALPEGQLATRVARGAVLFLTALTVFIEFPLVIWSLLRDDLPPVETLAHHKEAQAAPSSAEGEAERVA